MSRTSALRTAAVEAAATLAVTGVWLSVRGALGAGLRLVVDRDPDGVGFDLVLVDLCAVALLVCAVWGWLATSAVVVEVLRGAGARSGRGVPAALRRVVMAACGAALVAGANAPALATAQHSHHRTGPSSVLDGLPLPDRALGGVRHHHHAVPPAPRPRTVVVRSGDTLWALAAADLPARADNAAIASRWHALYAANLRVIGPDPDLIEPGQTLHLPERT